jgi:hypothetical protein
MLPSLFRRCRGPETTSTNLTILRRRSHYHCVSVPAILPRQLALHRFLPNDQVNQMWAGLYSGLPECTERLPREGDTLATGQVAGSSLPPPWRHVVFLLL